MVVGRGVVRAPVAAEVAPAGLDGVGRGRVVFAEALEAGAAAAAVAGGFVRRGGGGGGFCLIRCLEVLLDDGAEFNDAVCLGGDPNSLLKKSSDELIIMQAIIQLIIQTIRQDSAQTEERKKFKSLVSRA